MNRQQGRSTTQGATTSTRVLSLPRDPHDVGREFDRTMRGVVTTLGAAIPNSGAYELFRSFDEKRGRSVSLELTGRAVGTAAAHPRLPMLAWRSAKALVVGFFDLLIMDTPADVVHVWREESEVQAQADVAQQRVVENWKHASVEELSECAQLLQEHAWLAQRMARFCLDRKAELLAQGGGARRLIITDGGAA